MPLLTELRTSARVDANIGAGGCHLSPTLSVKGDSLRGNTSTYTNHAHGARWSARGLYADAIGSVALDE